MNEQVAQKSTEYLRLFDNKNAEGSEKSGKSRTAHSVNCVRVPSVQPNILFAVSAHGLNVFHMEQDHIVMVENTISIHHLCQ